LIDLNVSSRPEPDLGWRRKPCIQFIVEIAEPLIVVLVPALVVGVGSVSPPSVQQEAEEEGHDEASVKTMGMRVENSVTLKGSCSSPESAVGWQISSLRNES
jgi:hypothetical protein